MPANRYRIQRDRVEKPSRPPTKTPMIVENFAEVWLRDLLATGYDEYALAIPEAGPFRASWTSKRCDRALQYAMAGVPSSEPLTVADLWRMHLGTMVHDDINTSVRKMGDGWIPDIDVDLRPIGIPGSGHADLVRFVDEHGEPFEWNGSRPIEGEVDRYGNPQMEHDYSTGMVDAGWLRVGQYNAECMFVTHVAELKSVGGYAFKLAATSQQGPPEGPRYSAILQGALAAWALGVDKLIVANLSLECVSPKLAQAYSTSPVGRFAAEWKYLIGELMPILEHERDRVAAVMSANEDGELLERMLHDPEYPAGATVTSPRTGVWRIIDDVDGTVLQSGSTWHCSYCPHMAHCQADGGVRP